VGRSTPSCKRRRAEARATPNGKRMRRGTCELAVSLTTAMEETVETFHLSAS
jgi:hypothetical protein